MLPLHLLLRQVHATAECLANCAKQVGFFLAKRFVFALRECLALTWSPRTGAVRRRKPCSFWNFKVQLRQQQDIARYYWKCKDWFRTPAQNVDSNRPVAARWCSAAARFQLPGKHCFGMYLFSRNISIYPCKVLKFCLLVIFGCIFLTFSTLLFLSFLELLLPSSCEGNFQLSAFQHLECNQCQKLSCACEVFAKSM